MKKLKEADFKQAYGSVPDSFSRSVQAALRQTKEEAVMKQFTMRTAVVIALLMMVILTAAAVARDGSETAFMITERYGSTFAEQLSKGGDMLHTDDVVETEHLRITIPEAAYYDGTIYGMLKITVKDPEHVALIREDYVTEIAEKQQLLRIEQSGKELYRLRNVEIEYAELMLHTVKNLPNWNDCLGYDEEETSIIYYFEVCQQFENDPFILKLRRAEKYMLRAQLMYYPYACFQLGKHTAKGVCSGLSPLRRGLSWC